MYKNTLVLEKGIGISNVTLPLLAYSVLISFIESTVSLEGKIVKCLCITSCISLTIALVIVSKYIFEGSHSNITSKSFLHLGVNLISILPQFF